MKIEPLRFALLSLAALALMAGCKSRNSYPTEMPPAEVPPAGYEQGEEIPMPPEGEGQPGGRFGYRGGEQGQTPPPPPPPSTDNRGERETTPITQTEKKEEETAPEPPKPSGPPTPTQMPYANPVPGNPLVVTLPGKGASLGQISIEKYDSAGNPTGEPLKRGTQVQIPDPNNPGQKIYFKVP